MALSVKTRIFLSQLTVIGAVVLMAAAVYFSFRSFDYYFTRVSWSYEQLSEMTELATRANRYSEQIAELLLIGEPERMDYESAQAELQDVIEDLQELREGELAALADPAERGQELVEAERLERISTLYTNTNIEVERLFAMREAGQQEQAVRLFRREIEDRLDAELEQLVAAGVADEVDEVQEADRQFLATSQTLAVLVVAALMAALGATAASGYLLYRSLARPIRQLTEGADALGRGDLAHRVGPLGTDELGVLAARFDDMAAQLHVARSHLEEQVHQRTLQLQEANQRLRDVDGTRVRFLADISHELRTPLTVLRGEAEVTLKDAGLSEEAHQETLQRIIDQAANIGRLVEDLLFLARSETDQVPFEAEPLDLAILSGQLVHEGQVLGRARDVRVEAAITEEPALVEGDRQRLKQALLILLDNAVKYTASGSAVHLSLATDGDAARIAVRNSGPGIAPEDLPYIFDRFYRGKRSRARGSGGSGLGLSIAKWIIEKHGGSIAVSSDESGWTEVEVRLPMLQVDEPALLEEASW